MDDGLHVEVGAAREMDSCCGLLVRASPAAMTVRGHLGRREITPQRDGMIVVPGDRYEIGNDDDQANPGDGEGPARSVRLSSFLIDATPVTNKAFRQFVNSTGYVTEAERLGTSFVFKGLLTCAPDHIVGAVAQTPWWLLVEGAAWCAPFGPGSSIDGIEDHPVTHVSWRDAANFAAWSGKRLPSEAEWEVAAGGGKRSRFPWGDRLQPDGAHLCNVWQGSFPMRNELDDGFYGTSPVRTYPANAFGLFDVIGNVWEWCADWWSADHHRSAMAIGRVNPSGPMSGDRKVMRGGSYLCHADYCNRYRVSARHNSPPDTSTGHIGFRCAADLDLTFQSSTRV